MAELANLDTASASPKPSVRVLNLLLALANFAVGMGAFVVIGVLPPIAAEFGLSPAAAGWTMTVYALVYAVSSPVLIATTGGIDRARVLIGGLAALAAGALIAAVAPDFATLLAGRALMAIGGGVVTPVAAAVAIATVAPEHRGRSLSTVYGGLTLSQALGVPAGAWLGYHFGWHFAFVAVALLSAAATLVLFFAAPRGLQVQRASLASLGAVMRTPHLLVAVSFAIAFFGGMFVVYTYISPILEVRFGLSGTGISLMLLLFGIGAVIGNSLGGFLTDRLGPTRTVALLASLQLVFVPVFTLVSMPVAVAAPYMFLWSICAWAVQVPQQARLAAIDPDRAPVLLSLHSAAIYVGSSLGAAIGGFVLQRAGYSALGPVGGLVIALSLATIALTPVLRSRAARAAL